MAQSLHCLISSIIPLLLLIHFLIPSFVHGQTNGTLVDQSAYTNFELFKNTGLQPCQINTTLPKSSTSKVEARSPRGGGRGGGHGGGGGSSSGGGYSGGSFIVSTWIGDQSTFCSKMTGSTVMIPSTPTLYGFIPQWPTYIAQLLSLSLSFAGLWWVTKAIDIRGPHDSKIPIIFWILLPLDSGRIIVWLSTTIYGLAKPNHFAWFNVIIWVIPFNYIWIMRLIQNKNSYAPTLVYQDPSPIYDQYGHPIESHKEPHIVEANAQAWSTGNETGGTKKFYWISLLFAGITGLTWLLSLIVAVLHFKYNWSSQKTHPTYAENSNAVIDPSSIAQGIPQACVSWVRSSALTVSRDLLNVDWLQTLQTAIVAFQFVASSLLIGQSLRKVKDHAAFRPLRVSILATAIALAIPAIATGFWILGSVKLGKQDEMLIYTNNFNTTGGCTFASLNMNRQWGYWDVDSQRGIRIAMSLLGVA